MATTSSTAELYRQSKLGLALGDALDELVEAEELEASWAMRALELFDSAVQEELSQCDRHAVITGSLSSFRRVGGVLTLNAERVHVSLGRRSAHSSTESVSCGSARVLAIEDLCATENDLHSKPQKAQKSASSKGSRTTAGSGGESGSGTGAGTKRKRAT